MATHQDLFKVGAEYSEIKYDGFWDWFVQFGNVEFYWKHQPTFMISQFAFLFGALATLIHALKCGGRLPYLWLGTFLHGLVVEGMSYAFPDIDNFWQSQTPIMFLGRRLPLHITCLYPSFIYNASVAVAKMRLAKWAEPFAVGLVTVLIDIPYDIIGINYIHWTWHDTDPNIFDRHYWVPWNSYYFHACFAASFTFWFHFTRKLICKNKEKWESSSFIKETICTLIPSVLGTVGGILLFIPIYHPLHDVFKIHSEVTFFVIFSLFLVIIWTGDRAPKIEYLKNFKHKTTWATWILILHLCVHYSAPLLSVIFFKPENEISVGLRERIGPCDAYIDVNTVAGVLKRKKYLCQTNYDEKFNFKCLEKPPSEGAQWYSICGSPLENKAEYVLIISLICILATVVFKNLHFKSFGDDVFPKQKCKVQPTKKQKQK